MLTNKIAIRPADLPDFTSPPVTEVVLGVQFNRLERFLTPHIGAVWDRFKLEFPRIEEHPPLPPAFETFGSNPQFFPGVSFQIGAGAEMPRVFFMNADKTQLLQVQRDRFFHNWRKTGTGSDYPRFERMLKTFVDGFEKFVQALASVGIESVVPNQCEVSYINQIPALENEGPFEVFKRTFPQQASGVGDGVLGAPEDMRFLLRYVMFGANEKPIGRVIVSAEPARRGDGVRIMQLTLTARGKPQKENMEGVIDFLQQGRLYIVWCFTELTSADMHKVWGKTS
jgi:uncharacterized protein (TIGR04255 family)